MSARRLGRDCRGSSAAEFAIVLPLLVLFLFGIIDAGRWLWEINRAEKATQVGARFAAVTSAIPGGLASADYVGVGVLTQGDLIPRAAFGKISCTNTACCNPATSCTSPYPAVGTFNSAVFQAIVTRMRAMKSDITGANVIVTYEGSGLGYAGDPNGMDLSPIVTVKLTGMTFKPITSLLFANLAMPDFATSLTTEDAIGTQSN